MNRDMRWALLGGIVLSAVVACLVLLLTISGSATLQRTLTMFLVSVCLVTSLQLFVGNSGILSFGHVAFMAVGAYVTALVTIQATLKAQQVPDLPGSIARLELGLLPAVLSGGLVAVVVATLVGFVLVSMREDAMVMATLALLVAVYTVLLNWTSVTRGSQGLFAVPELTTPTLAILAATSFIVAARTFKSSRWGLQLRASREDPLSAASVGINVARIRLGAWVLSALMMGIAGGLWALAVIAFGPGQFFFAATFSMLAMLVAGGRESVLGAVVGVAIVSLITETLAQVEQGVAIAGIDIPRISGAVQLAVAALIIVTLMWRPQGLVGRRELDELVPRLHLRDRLADESRAREGSLPTAPLTRAPRHDRAPVLAGQGLTKSFSGLRALSEVDVSLSPGEILGLIGPNGSGKSTLLNVLSGVTRPDSGQIDLNGDNFVGRPAHEFARSGLSRTFQNIRLFGFLTVRENVQAAARGRESDAAIDALLESLGLAERSGTYAVELPYGLQRRLEIARALVSNPTALLLDEPAAGMNESESDGLLADIRRLRDERGCAVLVVDHDLRLIMRLCQRVQVLEEGRTIAVGTPDLVSKDPAVVRAYLGSAAEIA